MGRLIDADVLREDIYFWGHEDYEPSDFIDAIDDAPTVEAIPKADYENRLKADMVAMLTELQLEIEEKSFYYIRIFGKPLDEKRVDLVELDDVNDIIQQKIDKLKETKDGQ